MNTTSADMSGLAVREISGPKNASDTPRVVLVHGAMDTGASFSRLIGHLGGLDVVSYDRRGYGESRLAEQSPARLADHVGDLLALLDGHRSMVLAHSLGGVIALAAAERAPHLVRGILVYEAPMPWESWWPPLVLPENASDDAEVRAAAEEFLRRHLGDARWEALDDDRREGFLRHGPAWAAELGDARDGGPAFLPEAIEVPVLAVYGTATDSRHERATQELARRAPQGRLATIGGANHLGHRTEPGRLAELLIGHMAATEGTSCPTPDPTLIRNTDA
ncbi:alpha/beta fold hydrolase [Arthrobacter sp. ISL-72]|uniref:alpha/beta fold hydrolase n=1 Tax=Arthrobacter sp. ISL-72 TaxID=2819114 RepID=UPI001BED396A|nr:alpha/beta hydrolase [Arthrobacter sp. ISL-72]MBT2597868.1 alpha/beta hydrolase [Arthrobacter sp. ISL-72]